jgi:hypothetical protein
MLHRGPAKWIQSQPWPTMARTLEWGATFQQTVREPKGGAIWSSDTTHTGGCSIMGCHIGTELALSSQAPWDNLDCRLSSCMTLDKHSDLSLLIS